MTALHPTRRASRAIAALAALVLAGSAGSAAAQQSGTHGGHGAEAGAVPHGTVEFRVSCAADARPAFDRALASLHHMMYEQARSAFQRIAEQDPDCAMAHWGVATTRFQPLWGTRPSPDDLTQGWREIEKARSLAPATERERRLIAATEGFFREPEQAEFWTRIRRWADGMEEAYRAAPEDRDVAALYALSRLTLAQRADDGKPLHDEAEAVLRKIYDQEPTHPGAVHYTIHANDATGRADRSLDIVRSYGEIAPEVPHALHMPSHIYVRLGDWPGVIEWNRRSADAALKHPAGDAVSHHYIHAADYLMYAHLQRGEDDQAADVLKEVRGKDNHQLSFVSAFHHASLPARFAVERRQWEEAAKLEPRSPGYLPWDQSRWAEGLTWLARGLGAVHTGDLAAAREAEQRLNTLRDQAKEAGDSHFATYIEIDRLIVAGWTARAENQADKAVELVRDAAKLEGTVEKHPVTPGALLPPSEALGDLLLDLDRPAEALAAYRASSEVWPGRFNTILGAARAAKAAGERDAARKYYEELLGLAEASTRRAVQEAREFVGG